VARQLREARRAGGLQKCNVGRGIQRLLNMAFKITYRGKNAPTHQKLKSIRPPKELIVPSPTKREPFKTPTVPGKVTGGALLTQARTQLN
jgi:hypothetical protein